MTPEPTARIDRRFSDPESHATPWAEAARALADAELYWLTTVRAGGRPHVTPLVGVADPADGTVHFCTGLGEQKARNLEHDGRVAVTTGQNTWAQGLDVVVEGTVARITDREALQRVADAYEDKYGSAWHFDVGDGAFRTGEGDAAVFRVTPEKVMAFAKEPHAQTTFRFGGE